MARSLTHHRARPGAAWTTLTLIMATAMAAAVGGCDAVGVVGDWFTHDKKVDVVAEYTGLTDKSVAVIVSADEMVLYRHPKASLNASTAISGRLAEHVQGATLTDPRQIVAFQEANPAWATVPYAKLIDRLDVDRLLYVDLIDYTTHDPDNSHTWRGVVAANVHVIERENASTNRPAYSITVNCSYPPNRRIGVLDADDQTIEHGMLEVFSRHVAWHFHDHKEPDE